MQKYICIYIYFFYADTLQLFLRLQQWLINELGSLPLSFRANCMKPCSRSSWQMEQQHFLK